MEKHFKYCEYSSTIRLFPANYCVAVKKYDSFGHFVAEVDAAVDDKLAAKIFLTLRACQFKKQEETLEKLNSLL